EALRQDLVSEMRGDGYLGADVRLDIQKHAAPQLEGRPAGQVVDAHLVAQPGLQTRLRSVIIQGNSRTHRSVIARELALAVGQPITPQGIEETRQRLYDLDLFQSVSLELVGEDDSARDLIVVVEERPPMLLELSGGVATDRGVSARGRVALRNLGGRGQRISLLGQTGYAWQGDGWRIDTLTPVWRAAIRYEAPNVPARGQRLVAEAVLNETVQEPTFRTSDVGGSLGVRVRIAERSEVYLAYGVHRRALEDVDPGALVTGDPWLTVLGLDAAPVTELDLGAAHRLVTGPSLTAVLDRRDDPLDPRQGWRAAGKLDVHDGLLTQQASLRCEGRFDLLAPLGSLILAASATGGVGISGGSSGTLPVDERFYLGGSGSLRGFRPSSVGPARRVPRPDIAFPSGIDPLIENTALADASTHWVETGGDAMAAGTLELRVPLATLGLGDFDDAWLVGFSDVGRVTFLSQAIAPTSRVEDRDPAVRVGIGGGLRLATAIGPVSLLVGLNPQPIAGRDEATVLLHFTLGDL
ncbi:MAG: BamA/TamA family outer membrane protein, partial [Oligoflexia bacterium]|nr:BamA/TamA family outer membrane protein [Oligoflexia bacterium]